MIDYTYANLFINDSVDKQLNIISDDGKINITNSEIHDETFELTESLCSESELTFGACEAGMVKFTVSNVFLPMKGKWLNVKMTVGGNTTEPFQSGRYKVYSDTPTADRKCRDVVAYDALYDVINADVTSWYNSVFPAVKKQEKQDDGTIITTVVYDSVTMKQFRNSFFKHFGIAQMDISLINDDMSVEKTIEVTESSEDGSTIGEAISGKDVLSCILEINGCMGHMGRDGKFHYVYLEQNIQGLYPRNDLYPADDLYPMEPKGTKIGKNFYITAQYEDFTVKSINKVQIREKENDIGATAGNGNNTYIIEDNFLVYGMGTEQLTKIAKNILSKIKGIVYRPFSADCKGNPCLEVGDAIRLSTKYELIESYVLKRTLKGIQALRDSIEADGEEHRTGNVNSVQRSIIQLKGKSNTLERSIEETRLTIVDVEKGLQSQITQTASEIRSEVKNTTDGLSSRITQNASSITAEVTRATNAEGTLSSKITQTAESITAEVTRATDAEGTLSSKITQTATQIKQTVAKSQYIWDETGYTVDYHDYGSPTSSANKTIYPVAECKGKYYLNVSNGYLYLSDGTIWNNVKKLKKITTVLESSITQNAEQIELRVQKGSVISSINQTAETITIKASKINLKGVAQSDTFITELLKADKLNAKYATIESLNAVNGKFSNLNADTITAGTLSTDRLKVDEIISTCVKTKDFTAENISAMNITVKSANVTGGFNASKITSGKISADRLDATTIASIFTSSNNITVGAVNAESLVSKSLSISAGASLIGKTVEWKTATISGVTIHYLGYKEN